MENFNFSKNPENNKEMIEAAVMRCRTAASLVSAVKIFEDEADPDLFENFYFELVSDEKLAKETMTPQEDLEVMIISDLAAIIASLMTSLQDNADVPIRESYLAIMHTYQGFDPEMTAALFNLIQIAIFEHESGLTSDQHYAVPLSLFKQSDTVSFALILGSVIIFLMKKVGYEMDMPLEKVLQKFAGQFN